MRAEGSRLTDQTGASLPAATIQMSIDQLEIHKELPPVPTRRFERLTDRRRGFGRRSTDHPTHESAAAVTILEAPANDHVLVREGQTRRLLGTADAAAALVSMVVVGLLADRTPTVALLAIVPLVIGMHKLAGLYDRDDLVLRRSTLDDLPQLLQLNGLYALLAGLVPALFTGNGLTPAQMAGLWGGTFVLTACGRALARTAVRRSAPPERCLVIGDPARAAYVRGKLEDSATGAHVVATLRVAPGEHVGIDSPDEMRRLVDRYHVDRVVLVPVSTDSADTVDLIRIAKAVGVRVSVLPRMFEVVGSAVEFEHIDGMTMLGVRQFGLTHSSRAVKRAFDVVGAGLGLIAVSPMLVALALAIRLDTRGPIFFRQTRVGRDGAPFRILKFRSMCMNAEDRKDDLRCLNEAGDGMFKITNDPRVTRVGRFLRRTSLDELPQLINVLRGEMSLVGPRPLVVDEDVLVEGMDRSRLHLTPGMTGPWQVLGSTRVPMEEMVGIDYLYVANWSLWADIKLLLQTVPHVVAHRGL